MAIRNSADDSDGHRLALATLMDNGHARPCQITPPLALRAAR